MTRLIDMQIRQARQRLRDGALVIRLVSDEFPLGIIFKFSNEEGIKITSGYNTKRISDLEGVWAVVEIDGDSKTYIGPKNPGKIYY